MNNATSGPGWATLLDVYDWRARALPAVLALAPAIVALLVIEPGLGSTGRGGLALVISSGFFIALARVARDLGRRCQDRLFASWGGSPAVQLLRHRDERVDVHTKRLLHRRLEDLSGVVFPTASRELEDMRLADEAYRAATHWLIRNTRDTRRFPLLFKENINFGFQRNAFALRFIGVGIAASSLAGILFASKVISINSPYYLHDNWVLLGASQVASLMFSALMTIIWLFGFSAAAAERTGFAYAERLLESVDSLGTTTA